jgi:glycosyltransferase involved in cell wall biosynthesis
MGERPLRGAAEQTTPSGAEKRKAFDGLQDLQPCASEHRGGAQALSGLTGSHRAHMEQHRKTRVLFVAGFRPMQNGETGGSLAVSMALFTSPLAQEFELVPVSSTSASVPAPPLTSRAMAAAKRLVAVIRSARDVDVVMLFAADGLSVVEKGLIAMGASLAGKGVVLRLSAGTLPEQCEANPFIRTWLRLALRAADVVCVQGATWMTYFGSFSEASGKLVTIPNPVVLGPEPVRATPPDCCHLIFVGWTVRQKGVFEALDVVETLRVRWPRVRLTILGGGADKAELDAQVKRRGLSSHVTVVGWVPPHEVRRYLEAADVFFLPSHYEGLPNAMLEAMACALPVVVTNVGSIPDVVTNGHEGFVTAPRDVAAMARAIERLFADPSRAREMGRAGREKMARGFTLDRVWRQYAAAIERARVTALPTQGYREPS